MDSTKMNEHLKEFNKLLEKLIKKLVLISPESIIGRNSDIVPMMLRKDEKCFISLFILYVLPDEDQITGGKDEYFMKKPYDDVVKDQDDFKVMMELKNIWGKLEEDNKKIIRKVMTKLCEYSRKYLVATGILDR